MTNRNGYPPMLNGCEVLTPMEPSEPPQSVGSANEDGKSKRKPKHHKTAGRFAVLNAFVDVVAGELIRSDILVWFILFRDTRNGTALTSQADIARRANLSVRTVGTAVRRLAKRGLLVVVYRGGLNRGPSRYRVTSDLNGGPRRQ